MTHAEQLNRQFGRDVFAQRVDKYGLPENGWAVPQHSVTTDVPNRRLDLCVGTFRVGPHGALERASKQEYLPLRDLELGDAQAGIRDRQAKLLAELVDSLSSQQQ